MKCNQCGTQFEGKFGSIINVGVTNRASEK
jgi:hypothetical protein